MEGIIGKAILLHTSHLPQKITVNLFDKAKISNEFNKFFPNVRIGLARKIFTAKIIFETYAENVNSTMESKPLSINEFKDPFFPLKIHKSTGFDEISFNVVKKCFGELYDALKFTFELSLEKRIVLDDLEIGRVTPFFKGGDHSKLGCCRQISIFPFYNKIFERVMYNHIYKYLLENIILFPKQFGFQFGYSTELAVISICWINV